MKGFLTAIILLAILISFLFFYNFYIKSTFKDLSERINQIENSLADSDLDEAKTLSQMLYKELKKDSVYLYYVTDRTPIDNALVECSKLISFIETENLPEACATATGIGIMLSKTEEKSVLKSPW